MKLFQIEEPDGSPMASDAPGAAVGIDIAEGAIGRVAVAVGGNAEILPDAEGSRALVIPDGERSAGKRAKILLLGLRGQAEKQLAQPVTHAVIACGASDRSDVESAAVAAGITVLRLMTRDEAAALAKGVAPDDAAALGAAIMAEDLAPPAI